MRTNLLIPLSPAEVSGLTRGLPDGPPERLAERALLQLGGLGPAGRAGRVRRRCQLQVFACGLGGLWTAPLGMACQLVAAGRLAAVVRPDLPDAERAACLAVAFGAAPDAATARGQQSGDAPPIARHLAAQAKEAAAALRGPGGLKQAARLLWKLRAARRALRAGASRSIPVLACVWGAWEARGQLRDLERDLRAWSAPAAPPAPKTLTGTA
ncbi:hypothetical protein DSM112329_02540 [Paraconexibacter sp. AEG42_29]|uniref:Uncharacterized protein n=1 Tax=Paraconexibacter sp. AEG42_29 TaxID=2997339 RepID=A0AAU7AVM1_9ACTN